MIVEPLFRDLTVPFLALATSCSVAVSFSFQACGLWQWLAAWQVGIILPSTHSDANKIVDKINSGLCIIARHVGVSRLITHDLSIVVRTSTGSLVLPAPDVSTWHGDSGYSSHIISCQRDCLPCGSSAVHDFIHLTGGISCCRVIEEFTPLRSGAPETGSARAK
jgi:hypothetical protein